MTDKKQLVADLTTFPFFKEDPDIAGAIIDPPPPGTKRYNKCRALAKKVRDSARLHARPPLDPFGRLAHEIEQSLPALRDIEEPTNPSDKLLQLRFAVSILLRSITPIYERFVVRDGGADFDALARTVIYLPPAAEFIAARKTIGYKVDVSSVREAERHILELAGSSEAGDVRTTVASAFLHLVTTLLWPMRKHLAEDHSDTWLYFYFDDDPETYRYLEVETGELPQGAQR